MLPTHRLPVSDALTAAALHTAGFPVTPQVTLHEATGARVVTWWVDQNPAAAENLLAAWRTPDPAKRLDRTAPEHPFLAAYYGGEAVAVFRQWLDRGGLPPILALTRGRLRRVFAAGALPPAYDHLPACWADGIARPALGVPDAEAAAALAVCGVPFWPALTPPGAGRPAAVAFAAESLTFPGFRPDKVLPRLGPDGFPAVLTDFPPGFPAGEHPWEYALAGARNASLIAGPALRPAEKNPSIWFQCDGGRGALASLSLLEESHPNSDFRDALHDHLTR